MSDAGRGFPASDSSAETVASPLPDGWGWYLYGIARRHDRLESALAEVVGIDRSGPVQLLLHGDLAAIVGLVSLAEFGAEGMRARLSNVADLEAMIRGHDRVIARSHRAATILPAKLGCVYLTGESLLAELERSHAALAAQLDRLEGYDEWGIRVYADRSLVEERLASEDLPLRPALGGRQELAAASPGRAYFLKRQMADRLASAAEQALSDLAQEAYDHLAGMASDGQIGFRPDTARLAANEVEILRAAFLVSRDRAASFVAGIHRFSESHRELRSEYNGPWAPYSFATLGEAKSP